MLCYAQNPLDTFPRYFPVYREVANLLQYVVVMEFGKRHDTTDTTDFARVNLLRTCYGEADVMNFGIYTVLLGHRKAISSMWRLINVDCKCHSQDENPRASLLFFWAPLMKMVTEHSTVLLDSYSFRSGTDLISIETYLVVVLLLVLVGATSPEMPKTPSFQIGSG